MQQINSKHYYGTDKAAISVNSNPAETFLQVSAVVQGTDVDNCNGTSIYAKSIYVQFCVGVNPWRHANGQEYVASNAVPDFSDSAQMDLIAVKAKAVRLVVLLDRAPNGTTPTYNNVYLTANAPNITGRTVQGNANACSSVACLDPKQTRRFKILMNEVVISSWNNPIVHVEKYIPLNMYMTYSGNNVNAPSGAHIVTNGIYVMAFCDPELNTTSETLLFQPYYTVSSKLRFEP